MTISVLIVDDDPGDREMMDRALKAVPNVVHPILEASDEASCFAQLESEEPIDCVLLDYSLPGRSGLSLLRRIVKNFPDTAVVMITGQGDENVAAATMKAGAQDYLRKDWVSVAQVERAIINATERTRMQRKIRTQQEDLQTFTQVMVHDLRAPLRSLRLAIDRLTNLQPGGSGDEYGNMLDYIAQSAQRMDDLILSLDAYTAVDRSPPALKAVDLNPLVEQVRASLGAGLEEVGALVTRVGRLPVIMGDPPQIELLLRNLVDNGIKYNRSGAPEIRISAQETAGGWDIDVRDNGIGIEPRLVDIIFQPFKRLHGDGEFPGTGLGLATCRKIAARNNMTLSCRSQPGAGSVFTLAVPAGADAEA